MVNPLVVNPLVKNNEIFFDKNSRAFFQSLFTGKLQRVEDYIKREYQADPTALYTTWLKQFGTDPLRKAWTIIRDTKTALDINPTTKGYAKNLRFIKFCQGELDGREDPPHLCALHTRATSPAPKVFEPLPVRSAPPKPLPVPPSIARRRERDARIAAEKAA